MQKRALTVCSRCKRLLSLSLFTLSLIGGSVAPAFAQRDAPALIAQAQQAVRAKLLRERGAKGSSVRFEQAKKYTLSKAQQSVRGTGVFRRDPQAPAQDFSYQVVFDVQPRPYTIVYVSYLITVGFTVPE